MLFRKQLLLDVLPALYGLAPMRRGDDIAFSLLCRRKHFAVDVEPLVEVAAHDQHALSSQRSHMARRQEMVDRVLAGFDRP